MDDVGNSGYCMQLFSGIKDAKAIVESIIYYITPVLGSNAKKTSFQAISLYDDQNCILSKIFCGVLDYKN